MHTFNARTCILLALAAISATATAQDDVLIVNDTPSIIFEDDDSAVGGWEWVIKGHEGSFRLQDYSDNQKTVFGVDAVSDSVHIGYNSVSNGPLNIALGVSANAQGSNSAALGRAAQSDGADSLAAGRVARAYAASSTAIGHDAIAAAAHSSAIGYFSTAEAPFSSALGSGATAWGEDAVAVGLASAGGVSSTAVGHWAVSNSTGSTALGHEALANGEGSSAIGYRAYVSQPHSLVLGSIRNVNGATQGARVAIGITQPDAPLHIFRSDDTQELLKLESDEAGGAQDRAMIGLINNGGIRFQFDNKSLGTAWRFQAATGNQDNFEVTKVGTGEIEFRVDADGNAHLAGILFENSDRDAKTGITPVNPASILEKVVTLPVAHWAYRDSPASFHIGPMAQDFHAAFGTGDTDRQLASIDLGGVALASIQALSAENTALRTELAAVKSSLQKVRALLESIVNAGEED